MNSADTSPSIRILRQMAKNSKSYFERRKLLTAALDYRIFDKWAELLRRLARDEEPQ